MASRRARRVAAPTTKLQDLPDALLTLIAQGVDSTRERRTLLPVLSKRWAGLLQGSGPAWEVVRIDTGSDFPGATEADAAAMVAWFSRRAGSVRDLCVDGSLPMAPVSLMPAILMTQAASLRVLHLVAAAVTWVSGADLASLAALRGLEILSIELSEDPDHACWDDHGAAVINILSRLPALKRLEIWANDSSADAVRPTVSELAALRGPALSQIYWDMASIPEGTLALGALPALASCNLNFQSDVGDDDDPVLHVTAASFSGAPALAQLTLAHVGHLYLAPNCFSGLSALAELNLVNCELGTVPAALAGVQHSLRVLDLSRNYLLQIDQAGFDALMALPLLERLNLKKGWTVPCWVGDSLSFLVRFLSEWQRLHPEASLPAFVI